MNIVLKVAMVKVYGLFCYVYSGIKGPEKGINRVYFGYKKV